MDADKSGQKSIIGTVAFAMQAQNLMFYHLKNTLISSRFWLVFVALFAFTFFLFWKSDSAHPKLRITLDSSSTLSIKSLVFLGNEVLLSCESKVGETSTGNIIFWNTDTGLAKQTLKSPDVSTIALSSDSQILASGEKIRSLGGNPKDGQIKVWNVKTGKLFRKWITAGHPITSIVFSADDKVVVSGGDDGTVKMWELKSGRLMRIIANSRTSISDLSLSADGKLLACATGTEVLVYDLNSGKILQKILVHHSKINSLDFSSRGVVASGGFDKNVVLWDFKKKTILHKISSNNKVVTKVIFSPDGKKIIVGYLGRTIIAWDVQTGRSIQVIDKNTGGRIKALAFSPNGRTLASSDGAKIKIWDFGSVN